MALNGITTLGISLGRDLVDRGQHVDDAASMYADVKFGLFATLALLQPVICMHFSH